MCERIHHSSQDSSFIWDLISDTCWTIYKNIMTWKFREVLQTFLNLTKYEI